MGGPITVYTPELAEAICERLADGMTLRQACRDEGMPKESTVRRWVLSDTGGFCAQYARAREVGYQAMADELIEISDNGTNDWIERETEAGRIVTEYNGDHVTRSRLRTDTRKWLLSKALPKVYGDRVALTGPEGGPIEHEVTHVRDNISRKLDRTAASIEEASVAGQPYASRT